MFYRHLQSFVTNLALAQLFGLKRHLDTILESWSSLPTKLNSTGYDHALMPNTHRRRRRDETVLSRRVGVGGV